MFCRASVALWASHWNTWACAHPPHCPPERQKLDLSDKLSPLQRTLWKCVHCKRLLNLSCGVVWLLVLPASPCTCGLFLECQLHVQPVGCSWDCKWQLLLLNGTWWRGGDGEKSTCLQSTWLHKHACPGHYTCTGLCLLLIIPPFSWDRGAQPFWKAINPLKANKLQAGVVHVSASGPWRGDKNGGEFLFSCAIKLEDILTHKEKCEKKFLL